MKQLIIIGAGGMGRTMYSNALECVGYGTEFIVKGFLNDFPSLDQFENYPPIIGTIENYQPQDEDVFVCSIGDKQRKQCIEKIQGRGGEFINLIHQTARFYTNAKLGKGNFIGAYTVIGNDAQIGDFNMIQSYTVIGHDDKIGNWIRTVRMDNRIHTVPIRMGQIRMIRTDIRNGAICPICRIWILTILGRIPHTAIGMPMRSCLSCLPC